MLRPMLAAKCPEDLNKLRFPLLASAKLDGVRALIKGGIVYSRTMKPLRNKHVQRLLGKAELEGLDGEIIVGSPTAPNAMQATTSGVMSFEGEPDFTFHVFDNWTRKQIPFELLLSDVLYTTQFPDVVAVHPQEYVTSVSALEAMEQDVLSAGYEGLILRDPHSPYKMNRSTLREGYLIKLKRFAQDEAVVVGVQELMHNDNEPELDERGYTKRSSAQGGQVPSGKLGALVCHLNGIEFNIGTGFDDYQRKLLWQQRESLIGRIVTFKHFNQQGVLSAPRHPVFISFRDPIDL